jgi:hypothetical protein
LIGETVGSQPPLIGEGVVAVEGGRLAAGDRDLLTAEVGEDRGSIVCASRTVGEPGAGHGHCFETQPGLLRQVKQRHHVIGAEVPIDYQRDVAGNRSRGLLTAPGPASRGDEREDKQGRCRPEPWSHTLESASQRRLLTEDFGSLTGERRGM